MASDTLDTWLDSVAQVGVWKREGLLCGMEWRVVCMWQGGDSVCVGSRLGDVCTVMMTRVSDDNLVTMIIL